MKNKKILSYLLLILYIVIACAFTLLAVSGYDKLVNSIDFRVEQLLVVIVGCAGVIASLALVISRAIKIIGDKK